MTAPAAGARRLVLQRLREVSHATLGDLVGRAPFLRTLSPPFVRAARAERDALRAELLGSPERQGELAELMADAALDFLGRERPYLELGARREAALAELYGRLTRETLRALASEAPWPEAERALGESLERHQERLRAFVLELLAEEGELGSERAVCAEYAPALQLRVLGLRPEAVAPPVLDLGCGPGASLVRHLRARGVPGVLGVDRSARRAPGVLRRSWLELALPPATFGTVVAHQSFTLHFLRAHLRPGAEAERYARRYVEILEALRPGGRFVYAPGLPFVEAHLPRARFGVTTRALRLPGAPALPPALAAVYGPAGLHATAVERLA